MIIFILFKLLFSNALALSKDHAIFYSRNTILTLIISSYICYNNLFVTNLDKGIALYGGIFNITSLTQSFTLFIFIISAIILLYNSFYHRQITNDKTSSLTGTILKKNHLKAIILPDTKTEIYRSVEYSLIILFIITGAVLLISTGDLISLFIAIELQSYGLYILSTLHRDSEQSTWGGLTYFLLGGLSSCFILLGSSLIYINTGTTSLDAIYIITSISEIWNNINFTLLDSVYLNPISVNQEYIQSNIQVNNLTPKYLGPGTSNSNYINISMIILLIGFLFKVSAAPFHFWSPDVYDSIPTTVTTYVAIIAKISIFILLFELVYYLGYINSNDSYSFSWKNCLLISSLFSLLIGSLLGLTQYRIKRVYAYSTINHVGFILLALSIGSVESITAYIFYIISYTITNLNAFIILVSIGITMYFYIKDYSNVEEILNRASSGLNHDFTKKNEFKLYEYQIRRYLDSSITPEKIPTSLNIDKIKKQSNEINTDEINPNIKEINYSPIQMVSQLKGYFYINPYLSLSLAITLFSFMGIPPLIGFFAKQMVLSAALDNGYMFLTLIGILTSAIGAGYYLNIVKQMFFFKSDYIINPIFSKFNYIGSLKQNTELEQINTALKNKSGNIDLKNNIPFNISNISLNTSLSITISILTLLLLLFIFIPNESFNLAKILTLLIFN